jgi:hypothetical protein
MDINNYLENIILEFKTLKSLADKAMAQLDDTQFFHLLDKESNSIALIVKHMAGNMVSRWTNFLTTDGEKSTRMRDTEFKVYDTDNRQLLMDRWKSGWKICLDTVSSLTPEDIEKMITIRSQPYKVYAAINRQLTHYGAHVGQIILLAKHYKGSNWETLSVARGKSEQHLKDMLKKWGKEKSQDKS